MTEINIESDQLKFPTKEERSEIQKITPKLCCFDFKFNSEAESIIVKKMSFADASRNSNLYWWDNCLINRIGKLNETFIYALTNYNRGFSEGDYREDTDKNRVVNGVMFDYYAEIYYYHFFSTRDIIAQIIRLYYRVDIAEDRLFFNQAFINKIENSEIKNLIKSFIETTKNASQYRNAFAHRFTPTLRDNRSTISEIEGKKCLRIGGGKIISTQEFLDNINSSINTLSVFLKDLKDVMNG